MRNGRALENIRAVIEQQETEWLRENGFEPVLHKSEPRKQLLQQKPMSGQFSADRFLNTSITETEAEHELEPVSEVTPEPAQEQDDAPKTPELEVEQEPDSEDAEPEIISIIKQKEEGHHSWLYNEVVKAIKDAAGDGKNTKVIAIFIPVVQNSREFQDLPVTEAVALSPINEEDIRVEELEAFREPEPASEPETLEDAEPITSPEPELEPVTSPEPELEPVTSPEPELEPVNLPEPEPLEEIESVTSPEPEPIEEIEPITSPEPEPLEEIEPVTLSEPADDVEDFEESEPAHELEPVTSPEDIEEPQGSDHIGDLLPAAQEGPDDELAEAFREMEEKFDEAMAEDSTAELLPLPDPLELDETDVPYSDEEDSKGEPMSFTEILLPPSLEDDEILDESGIEIQEDPEETEQL